MAFQILNKRQRFGELHWTRIISEQHFETLKKLVRQQWDSLSAKDQDSWEQVFSNLDQLPERQLYTYGPNKTEAFKVVPYVYSFTTKSPKNSDFPDAKSAWGLDAAERLHPYTSMITKWMASNNVSLPSFDTAAFKKAKELNAKFASGEYDLQVIDQVAGLARAEGCVIYIPDAANGGYLDGRGHYGAPLAGARMFENAASAYTTIRSRGLSSAVVVHVKSVLQRIDPQSTVTPNCQGLSAAIAVVEKKRLEEALEEASVEQLRARLARFEGTASSGGEDQPPAEEAPRKRRM